MKKKNKGPVSDARMAEYAENWQRCRTEDIPGLFQGYDTEQEQCERLVTFKMNKDALKAFQSTIKAGSDELRFIVHLGLLHNDFPAKVPKKPAFQLFIQALYGKKDWHKNCFPLEWDSNGKFSQGRDESTNNGAEAISAASAYLFVHSWMETFTEDLALPFESVSHDLDRRVKAYQFSNAESKAIAADLGTPDASAKGLYIHLGRGLAVARHPFSFRPVIDVAGPQRANSAPEVFANATGLLDGDGDSFYDFGAPIPPGSPDD
ncbi:hypothetical protein [Neolewinella agarilytica]|uniref:Uncharacterized protein n=1 Tax=Neolewinella agarilytica TaxID=478744 RepID=A0A1H8Z5Q6_9BACT|nr:hypothetical protein [Neolewinella agarilytica]SEP59683.1 hypothetical protein SAMN05444359_101186 [Neolewinella agarilytica]